MRALGDGPGAGEAPALCGAPGANVGAAALSGGPPWDRRRMAQACATLYKTENTSTHEKLRDIACVSDLLGVAHHGHVAPSASPHPQSV